MENVTCLFM